jgi:hypothetical protein
MVLVVGQPEISHPLPDLAVAEIRVDEAQHVPKRDRNRCQDNDGGEQRQLCTTKRQHGRRRSGGAVCPEATGGERLIRAKTCGNEHEHEQILQFQLDVPVIRPWLEQKLQRRMTMTISPRVLQGWLRIRAKSGHKPKRRAAQQPDYAAVGRRAPADDLSVRTARSAPC